MSLLMKALQQAAKSRDDGTSAAGTGAEAVPGASAAGDLQLEPIESAHMPSSAKPSVVGPDIGEEPESDTPRTRAATVLQAAAESRPRSGPIEYIRNHPLVAISTVAGLFMIGYGGYIYLQITNPGMFAARSGSPVKPPNAPVAATGPIAPAPGAVSQTQTPPGASPVTTAPSPAPSGNVETLPPPITSATSPAPAPAAVPAPGSTSAASSAPPGPPVNATASAGPVQAPSVAISGIPATQPPIPTTGTGGKPAPAAVAPVPAPVIPSAVAIPSAPVVAAPPPKVEVRAPTLPVARAPASSASDVPPRAPAAAAVRPVPRTAPADVPAVRSASTPATVDPTLLSAHQALEGARFDEARRLYQAVLASQPNDVDALLGLATIAVQQGRPDQATSQYARILELDPRNATAQAGLLGLVGRADPLAAELRLRQLISRESVPSGGNPVQTGASAAATAFLQFTLGNVHAEQNQWAQAQTAYFHAHNLQPDNPDYAFNLAVGLERLSQPKLALGFYRKAVELVRSRGHASFDVAVAEGRIRKLEQAAAQ